MISIILVTYNRIDLLKKILKKIQSYNWSYSEFIIINNNSFDETKDFLNTLDKGFKVINLTENIGHGAALSVGLKYIVNKLENKDGFTVFLEDDSIPTEKLLETLINKIKDTNFDFISSEGQKVKLGKRINLKPKEEEIVEADFCLFDGAIIKNHVIYKIGLHEEDWFMMFDDFEYCYRIRKNGFKIGVIYNNFHEVLHLGGGSINRTSSPWRGYYQTRNHVFFLKKHFSILNLLDFCIINFKRFIGCFFIDNKFQRIKYKTIGIYHGLLGLKGKTLLPDTLKFTK